MIGTTTSNMPAQSVCCSPKPITPPPFIAKGVPEVVIVSIPDNKEALYIDGKLVREDAGYRAIM